MSRLIVLPSAASGKTTVIAPDKDADGLCGGSIIYRTLLLLGHSPESVKICLVSKGSNVHEEGEHQAIRRLGAAFVIFVDQGSRPTRVTSEDDEAEVLIVDHHLSDKFPPGSTVQSSGHGLREITRLTCSLKVLTACHSEPVATSALLSYILCQPLHPSVTRTCDWLACMGTIGDLGSAFKWEPPFPDMKETFKRHTKKALTEAVSLINARKMPYIFRMNVFDN